MNIQPEHTKWVIAALTLLSGCSDSVGPSAPEGTLVVEAYLFAGEPVEDVRLTLAASLEVTDAVVIPVDDAVVHLLRDGRSFQLAGVGDGRYADLAGDIVVEAGDVFELVIGWNDIVSEATTVVPPPPLDVAISGTELLVPQFGGGFFGGGLGARNRSLTVAWSNDECELHYVVVESRVEGEPEYILPDQIRERFSGFRLVTPPTQANFYDIFSRSLQVLGPHVARVYRVNQEYADLYENREQDSRDLNEPPSNVRGATGVFSAFNSQTLAFTVDWDPES